MSEDIEKLESALKDATKGMKGLTSKKMFGCYALWAKENVFALVWKHGRIGVKLPVEKSYNKLMDKIGSEPWKAGPMKMSHWVLMPQSYHSKATELKKWVDVAYKECADLPKKPKKSNKL